MTNKYSQWGLQTPEIPRTLIYTESPKRGRELEICKRLNKREVSREKERKNKQERLSKNHVTVDQTKTSFYIVGVKSRDKRRRHIEKRS